MSWNHRVWKQIHKYSSQEEVVYSVRETYYNSAGEICACTEGISEARGSTQAELVENLQRMLRVAQNSPKHEVLDFDNFKFAKWNFEDEEGEENT